MRIKNGAARRSGNYERANVHQSEDKSIIADYEHGALIAGLLMALLVGLCMIHAAVML
jgi:hypothetical protein